MLISHGIDGKSRKRGGEAKRAILPSTSQINDKESRGSKTKRVLSWGSGGQGKRKKFKTSQLASFG